jgi:60 kDa SS-A/Ro ribonucleoprotein
VSNWYVSAPAGDVAFQAVKYQRRDGWSHRDMLRLAHPVAPSNEHNLIFNWIVKGWPGVGEQPHPVKAAQIIWAFERAKTADKKEILRLITDFRLPREALPTVWLTDLDVWAVMLPHMGLTAMLRNLGNMSRIGLLTEGNRETVNVVRKSLTSADQLRRARIHPIAGVRGSGEWKPVTKVIDALDSAFYTSFGNVESCGKRLVLALDVSGSMDGSIIASVPGLTARVGSAALSLVTAATEDNYHVVGFSHKLDTINISPRQRLDDVVRMLQKIPMGGTDCALPMLWALDKKVKADAFVVYTDSETWAGKIHPVQALRQYREKTGIPAKLVVVGMVSNDFSIADPDDAGMLDVVGFDTATPQLINDFVKEN